ncbi:MAG: hypothetical protein SFU99_14425 [Saprospiraceae bacterium]|nr:hypothetical protein [Saprospiraceae bacterium]
MKTLLLAFTVILLTFSCHDAERDFRSEGLITGPDARLCVCCGGWFIQIEGEPYRAYLSAEQFRTLNIDLSELPLPVRLDWELQSQPCLGDEIIVTRIERQ